MDIIITILIILVCIVVTLLILALFIPKHYSVTVSQTINRPQKDVFEYVSILQNQLKYSEWLKSDDTLKPEISGTDGTVGAILKWESNNEDKNKNTGKGEQEIKSMDDNNIDIELRLIKPMPGICKLQNNFLETETNKTLYTCTFSAFAKYPINLPSYLIGRQFIKKAQQKTLNNLKSILEESIN
ncbi:SRPBCC family protein [Chryseobacterium oryctis]|uniref:SRPBCC family protein n=1 Tax=Chryseobacterium oryctis TaxID=2952618 RepID=A0ABT3HPJ7_9FLAO|nr:SRPBCC family protein [Chryseobacterium oryctis]MCW3161703.1 SRPBCC family protein [Chryseobacterium oryctis]